MASIEQMVAETKAIMRNGYKFWAAVNNVAKRMNNGDARPICQAFARRPRKRRPTPEVPARVRQDFYWQNF